MNDAPGREARFRQLVTQDAYAAVWRYCYRLTGNREDAEDLGQESLARAFERIDQLRDDAVIIGWLFSIVRSRFNEQVRRNKLTVQPDYPLELRGPGAGPETDVVRGVVKSLPGVQREAVELFHFAGLNLAETATALGISVNTVKQRLHRGRETLKRRLEPSFAAGDLEALL